MRHPTRMTAPMRRIGMTVSLLVATCSVSVSAMAQAAGTSKPYAASAAIAAPSASTPRAAPASAQQGDAALVQRIAAQLGRHPVVQSRYTQTQTRAALRRPLISAGTLLFARDSGVVWTVSRPVQAVYAITDHGVRQVADAAPAAGADTRNVVTAGRVGQAGASDSVPASPPANGMPAKAPPAAAAQVSGMMRSMLGGDLSALYSQFDVSAQGTVARWRLRLTPNQPQIATAVRQIDLEGSDFVTSLDIVQANGDTLQWTFDDAHALPALPERERAWLSAK
ncbi:outer membrane lipoprotein carrier protein LolA [Robbsia sp. KACC 23696]|uniref:LolA family protein n=1 Tax=Robbsia sp. KACC 23696 TaxID=3149231 RepID=UPI00325B3FBF